MSGQIVPPDGWTVDPSEMSTKTHWAADGEGTLAAKSVGLSSPQPVMIKSRRSGGDAYMFTSGGKCCIWNMLSGDVYEFTKPTDLNSILAEMKKSPGQGSVERELLPVVS